MSWFGARPGAGTAPVVVATQPSLAPQGTALLSTQPRLPVGSHASLAGSTQVDGTFAVNEIVEYYSTSQGTWIPAKVLSITPQGTYNLDCKPDVTSDKIRRPSSSNPSGTGASTGDYKAGDQVEYFGATQGRWIPAKVLSVTDKGTYNLDCKPDVPSDKIRWPQKSLGSGSLSGGAQYKVNDVVEYFGTTLGKWIPAKVVAVNLNGTYNLDCKPDVPPEKIRPASGQPLGSSTLGSGPIGSSVLSSGEFPRSGASSAADYKVGDAIEYFAASQQRWIPAKVLTANTNGTFNLDCKPDVPPEKMRKQAPLEFKAGDVVEYFGATQGKWIAAKVLEVNANNTYNLDCKPSVPPDKVRTPQPGTTGFDGAEHCIGDEVEYFGATHNKWIPARVVVVNTNGTYDLDVKPGVLPDRVRKKASRSNPGYGSAQPMPAAMPAPSSIDCKLSGGDAPVQLLRVQRSGGKWRYEVCPEGAQILERHGARQIGVVSICGLYRTGKSYLLNLLLERLQRGLAPFQVGGTTRACTEGLWLWGAADSDDPKSPLLAFLDCEGFGSTDSDATRDAQLMALCALLSSVLVLNTKGALNEGIFNALSLTCHFAEHVEERGNEASRPMLLWVLRDFMLDLCDESGNRIAPDDYLEQALHAAPSAGFEQERGRAAREVRQGLLKFFSHRGCATLVRPADDESQLQNLEQLSYTTLRREFRDSVETLRAQVVSTCRMNPKTIGGQPIGCFAFIALLRQLVGAMNDSKMLSVKGAWETVQHTACGSLADDLRGTASKTLHMLASGQQIPGGAQLPLTDEALYTVLRHQRHELKAQWDDRALGDESVRKEYWQELKETLAREEVLVRQQNTRIADHQLMDAQRAWQEWLDDDNGTPAAVEKICKELGQTMERMPAAPLARASRAALEAATRRVAAARTAVAATVEKHNEMQRKAIQWGEQAAQQEGVARSQLDGKKEEIRIAQNELDEAVRAEQAAQAEIDGKDAELEDVKLKLSTLLAEIEEVRVQEHDLKAKQRAQTETESSLRSELEGLRAAGAKADKERLANERCARTCAEEAAGVQRRLEYELEQARSEAARLAKQLENERDNFRGESEKSRAEHQRKLEDVRKRLDHERNSLQGETEKTRAEHMRLLEEARRQLDDERKSHAGSLESEKDRLLERERNAGILEGKVQALTSETAANRDRVAALEVQARDAHMKAEKQAQENERVREGLEQAKESLAHEKSEGEARLKKQLEEYKRELQKVEEEEEEEGEEPRKQPKCCSIQ